VTFNQAADQVIFSGIENEIKVWDTRMSNLLYTMRGHTDCATGIKLSPDGHFIASNSMDNTGEFLVLIFRDIQNKDKQKQITILK
jgi:Prp8 binding protein